jgi:hypothetical protein
LAPDQRGMPSALERKALAVDDNFVNKAFVELKTKGRRRSHYNSKEKLLSAGNIFRLGARLSNCLTDEHFRLRPINRRIPGRRELYEVYEFLDITCGTCLSEEKTQDALAHQFDYRRLIIIPSRIAAVEIPPHLFLEHSVTKNHRPQELPYVSTRLSPMLRPCLIRHSDHSIRQRMLTRTLHRVCHTRREEELRRYCWRPPPPCWICQPRSSPATHPMRPRRRQRRWPP